MNSRIAIPTVILIAMTGLTLMTFGQSASQTESQKLAARTATSITGRVVNESGQPIPNAQVSVYGVGRQAVRRSLVTDEAGKFVAEDLPRGSYVATAQAHGYVLIREPRETVYSRPGDSVNLVLKKGAVITGRVTNSDGDPVVGVQVGATLVRDTQGRPGGNYGSRYTDDRGVYRIFGLPAGTFIVVAGSKTVGAAYVGGYFDDAPTY